MTKILLTGVGMGHGKISGTVKFATDKKTAAAVRPGDIVCIQKMQGSFGNFAQRAAGFIVRANPADHLATYIRETWKPSVLVSENIKIKPGQVVTVDAAAGRVRAGLEPAATVAIQPLTKKLSSKIYLQFSIPWLASQAAALNTDGVGLFRTNILLQEAGLHPARYKKISDLEKVLYQGITEVAEAFYPKPVWVRTMDFATSDLRTFVGGEKEPYEDNPLMGWRGIARELSNPIWLAAEVRVLKKAIAEGFNNIGVFFPMTRDLREYQAAKRIMRANNLRPHKDIKVGTMLEVPSAALTVKDFIADGLDFAFIGINDLTQYTLASDRTNYHVKHLYNSVHPAVLNLFEGVIRACKKAGIETTSTFQAPMLPYLKHFTRLGLNSVTIHPDLISAVSKELSK